MAKQIFAPQLNLNNMALDISMELDAFSVLITTRDTSKGKEWLRKYLVKFGDEKGLTRCSFPRKPDASNGEDGTVESFESGCQLSLPYLLHNQMMVVVDAPIKIALHVSCKEKLIHCLKEMGYLFSAAGVNSGLCFDPNLHPHKPPYWCMVEAIILSCQVMTGMHKGTNLVHMSQSGIRMPLPDSNAISMIIPNKDDAESWGISVRVLANNFPQCSLTVTLLGP